MSRISPRDLSCAFYLYPAEDAARNGVKAGGSGFWVGVRSRRVEEFMWIYAVSNRHVVHTHGAPVIRANAKSGGVKIIDTDPTQWIEHPSGHDIAVLPMDADITPNDIEWAAILTENFVTREHIANGTIGVGDDVFMIGRFINHEGKNQNFPSARFGNISMMPVEPIYVDKTTAPQESFVVELRSMCGYSGSPVFAPQTGIRFSPGVVSMDTRRPDLLLGIHWGHIIEPWTVEKKIIRRGIQSGLRSDEQEIDQVSANTGMNGVVPAWRLQELLDIPQLKVVRDGEEEQQLSRAKD